MGLILTAHRPRENRRRGGRAVAGRGGVWYSKVILNGVSAVSNFDRCWASFLLPPLANVRAEEMEADLAADDERLLQSEEP